MENMIENMAEPIPAEAKKAPTQKEYQKEYYCKNREKILTYNKEKYHKNKVLKRPPAEPKQ